ncbi:hypothetical protein SAMN00017405_0200 [Desulfonispora thiosulfatigenes DSM 11270]|uniref:Uncharacterized protein n=1 Tax=Desulfonispora thiosulfatigenes DSM 11270 TaxID=656914 RepID=A0A1W1VM03_DESTI|nr:hypothetical protein SAMN00017405_0200 [Desulfonispora thiosulfatigenes DSM 11270]
MRILLKDIKAEDINNIINYPVQGLVFEINQKKC